MNLLLICIVISKSLVHSYKDKLDDVSINMLSNIVMSHINMLCPCTVLIVTGKHSPGIIHVHKHGIYQ